MFRISVSEREQGTTLTLEGRLVGAWVDELGGVWRRMRPSAAAPVRVELDGVTFIDEGGKALLRAMRADGALLVACSIVMRAVVEEIGAPNSGRESARPPHA